MNEKRRYQGWKGRASLALRKRWQREESVATLVVNLLSTIIQGILSHKSTIQVYKEFSHHTIIQGAATAVTCINSNKAQKQQAGIC